jgi:protocatechuate 3,4-dioxygenase beta subunit
MSPYVSTTTSSFDFFSFFGPTATNPSAPNGRFVIKGLPAGVLQTCVDPTRGPVTGGHESGYAGRCVSRAAIARIGRSTDVADIALAASPSGVIAGVVRDPSGALVRNAAVFADRVGAQSFDDFGVTYTGQDGSYRLAVSRGRYRVCVDSESSDFGDSAYGGAPTCVGHIVRVAAGRTTTVNVRLAAAGAIAGRAIGPDGHALADVSVLVRPVGRRRDENYAQVQTDSRGFYTAKGLAPGTYVSCGYPSFDQPAKFPTGLAPSCTSRDTAAVAVAGLTQLGLDPKLPIGGAVRGRVTDDLGAPIANALVIVESPRTGDVAIVGTNPDGTYTATGLSGGRYDMCAIRVTPSGTGGIAFFGFGSMCNTPPVSVPAGQFIDVDLQIPTGGSVDASVRDERGRPIGAVDVAALRQCDPRGDDYCTRIALFGRHRWVTVAASEMTDADGTAALTGLEPGAYAICYFAYYGTTASGQSPTGYADGCHGTGFDVDVADHQSTHVDGELGAAGAVTGIVTDSTGKPLSGVQVTVSNAGTSDYFDPSEYDFGFGAGGPAADAVTDGTGRFFVHGVQPGKQTVCANAEGATGGTSTTGYLNGCVGGATARTASPVSVTAGRSAPVRLALQSGVAISGAVTNTAGRRVNALVIVFAGPHRPVAITQTLAGGRYRVSALPAGSYSVCFLGFRYKSQCFDGVPWSGRVRVPAAAATFVLKPGAERKHVDAVLHR